MKNPTILLLFLFIMLHSQAQKIKAYEYWVDDDVSSKVFTNITPVENLHFQQALPVNMASPGLHAFNIRFADTTNTWSSVVSQFFVKNPPTPSSDRHIIAYEYWVDDNYNTKTYQPILPSPGFHLAGGLVLNSVSIGLHVINIRFKDDMGNWSGSLTQYFTKYGTPRIIPNKTTSYRFWFDDDMATMETLNLQQPATYYNWADTVEIPFLTIGNHTINYQFKDSNQVYSSIRTDTFSVASCLPHGGRAITGASSVCKGQTGVVYSIRKIKNAATYTWSLPAGASIVAGNNTQTITVNYSMAAVSGNVSVFAANSCGNGETMIFPVSVHPLPVPTISGPVSVCRTSTGNVYSTQAGMTGYLWGMTAGGTITAGSGTNAITVTWNTTGAKSVSVNYTNSNGCHASTPTVYNVTVNPLPVPTISGPVSVCKTSTGNVYSTQTGMTGYLWSVSAGGTITAGLGTNTITVTWNTAGAQNVSVNYTNSNGCRASNSTVLNVTVTALPGNPGNVSGPVQVIQQQTGVSYSVAQITDATGYVWELPSGATLATGENTNTITVNFSVSAVSGNIRVHGTNFCGNGNLSQALFVNVIPTSFTVQNETVENGETRCFNAAQTVIVGGNGTTFIVNPGGSATIIAGVKINFLPQTMVNQGGTMHGYITTNNQYCTAASNPLVMNPASAPDPATTIPEATVNRNIRVYPNPTTAKVTVELTCEMETILEQIDIYSMAGLKLDSHKPEGEKRHELSMEGLKPGVYIVRIQTSKGAEIVKVIKL